ncbi:MAG: polysaccharide deacetylase family protein [Saprospiraceae bacterium]|nr:polysaccharide deacetylase family protein [Saprospiraceae bacterium]
MLTISAPPGFEAEKTYVCTVLLSELLGVPWQLQFSPETKHYCIRLPNGRALTLADEFWGRLPEDELTPSPKWLPAGVSVLPTSFGQRPPENNNIIGVYGQPIFATTPNGLYCGLDLFASTFFMLTRWEEAVSPVRDAYGRFPASASLAYREGFLHRPVVNEYVHFLAQCLARLGYSLPEYRRHARLHLSCDVDHPRLWWSWADRWRTLAGSLWRRRNLGEASWWIRRHFFRGRDPFDVFDEWMERAERQNLTWHFNFLGERPKSADAYYSLQHPFVQRLLTRIAERGHVIGFHPSRQAHADVQSFKCELDSLRRISPLPVTTGRQHYLCFSAPDTWQRWADAGMHWDSTLGYPEAEGFRCGICCDFPVFNFCTRQMLPLREKPLIAMDVTLAHYQGYTPEQALERLNTLWKTVQQYGGEFVLLWHNSSWNDYFWKDWHPVLDAYWGC